MASSTPVRRTSNRNKRRVARKPQHTTPSKSLSRTECSIAQDDTNERGQRLPRRPRGPTPRRQQAVNMNVKEAIHSSDDSQVASDDESQEVKTARYTSDQHRGKSLPNEIAHRRGGRGRSRKATEPQNGRGATNSQTDADLSRDQAASVKADTSLATVAAEVSLDDTMPKASSPIMTIRSLNRTPSKPDIKANVSKSHRGIVAEMYAHERRQTRNSAGAVNSSSQRQASRLGEQMRAAQPLPAPTYFPYAVPTMPSIEPSLSPFGISPYSEPGSSWTTNVYVNNLPPHTTDEDLLRLGSCFGRVKSHKAIINQDTGLCKGYGFIMYEFLHDAELAIQQLPLHGLSTSWAKESFSSKLRRMADSTTSNVYLSNLPQDITPARLETLFAPHSVVSLRILTDPATGKPRGVGFVRLRDRNAAQESIEKLNGLMLAGHEPPLQARFADSEAQKQFKFCARTQLSNSNEAEDGTEPASQPNAPVFVAALQGQHTWTGFATPASTSCGFSPMLGVMSPQMSGYPTVSPQMAPVPLFGADPYTHTYDPAAILARMHHDQFDPYAAQRMDWIAGHRAHPAAMSSAPQFGHQHTEPQHQPTAASKAASQTQKTRTTYLPPDLALQHARALMEKGAQGASQAHAFGLTQKHVENERADLLKLLKEANDNLSLLRASQASLSSTVAPTGHASVPGLLGLTNLSATDQKLPNGAKYGRRFSNPSSALGMTVQATEYTSPPANTMRPSVSAASLSPLRFLYSKDPTAPISVEAVDITSASPGCPDTDTKSEQKPEHMTGTTTSKVRAPTPVPGLRSVSGKQDGAADHIAYEDDQPSTVIEEEKENTTVESEAQESSYTSNATTTSIGDSNTSSGSAAVDLHKSDSGKEFAGKELDGHAQKASEKLPSSNGSNVLTGIMIVHPYTEKRNRSKSVVIHAPFDPVDHHEVGHASVLGI